MDRAVEYNGISQTHTNLQVGGTIQIRTPRLEFADVAEGDILPIIELLPTNVRVQGRLHPYVFTFGELGRGYVIESMPYASSGLQYVGNIQVGARIRTLVDQLQGAREEKGAILTVTEVGDYCFETSKTHESGNWEFDLGKLGTGFEVYSLAQASPRAPTAKAPPAPLTSLQACDWMRILASQVSVDYKAIPLEVHSAVMGMTTKSDVNKAFFAWHETLKPEPTAFDDAFKKLFTGVITPLSSREYINARDNALAAERNANDRLRRAQQDLTTMAQHQETMRRLEGNNAIDLWPRIEECLASGWYKLDVDDTRAGLDASMGQDMHVTFITSRVNINHFNARAGIEQNVDMGTYRVKWYPRNAYITVHPCEGNVRSGSYIHPHVSTDASVCWGNGGTAYTNSMREIKPVIALSTLQTILCNYNAESPYHNLERFKTVRDGMVSITNNVPTVMGVHDRRAWILREDMPDSWATSYVHDETVDYYTDDDEEDTDEENEETRRYLCSLFVKLYPNGTRAEPNVYYVKHRNGRYHTVTEENLYEWN